MKKEDRLLIWGICGRQRKFSVAKLTNTQNKERRLKMKILFCIIISLIIFASPLKATISWNDGVTHTINSPINELIVVDYYNLGEGTTVEIVNGGSITYLDSYHNSRINIYGGSGGSISAINNTILSMYGGTFAGIAGGGLGLGYINIFDGQITGQFSISDSFQASIYNGSIGTIYANGDKEIFIYDGKFNKIHTGGLSIASIFGGLINEDLQTSYNSMINLNGTNFYVNGNLMQYGQSAKLYGIPGINSNGAEYLGGTITGTLSNGDSLNVPFRIYENSDITFVPEPATIMLLSIGMLFLRKRK